MFRLIRIVLLFIPNLFLIVFAQSNYPDRALTMIIPFAPGSGIENVGRIIAQGMSKRLGQQIVVVNKPGAAAKVGTEIFLNSPKDGYTLLLLVPANAVNIPALSEKPSFDTIKDMSVLSKLVTYNYILVVNSSFPIKAVTELILYAKSNPGKLTFGSSGIASATHLLFETFANSTQIKLTHIPYQGEPLAMNDLLAGRIDIMFVTSSSKQFIEVGKIKALAIQGQTRLPLFKDTPTFEENSIKGLTNSPWIGLATSKGLPQLVFDTLWHALINTLTDDSIIKVLIDTGFQPITQRPEEFEADIKNEIKNIQYLNKNIRIKLD
jgi:hypothetical protein